MSEALPVDRLRVVWLSLLLRAAPLHAEPAAPFRLEYSAPSECPDRDGFAAQVRARAARGAFVEREGARPFSVSVAADAAGFTGSIEFVDEASTPVSRRVHGEQCEAVVISLALITALALDAAPAEREPTSSTPPAPPSPEPAPATLTRPAPRPAKESPRRVTPALLEGARVGLLAGFGSDVARPLLGVLGQLDFRNQSALRLTAHYAWRQVDVGAGRRAKLERQGLTASLCPRRFGVREWTLSPCLGIDLGSLRAEGVQSPELGSVRAKAIWAGSVAAELGAAWEPDAPFWAELRLAGELPLRAGYRFSFENPREIAYEVPRVAGGLALSAGVRFR